MYNNYVIKAHNVIRICDVAQREERQCAGTGGRWFKSTCRNKWEAIFLTYNELTFGKWRLCFKLAKPITISSYKVIKSKVNETFADRAIKAIKLLKIENSR